MHFNYLHFFVDDLATWRARFTETWGATCLDLAPPLGSTARTTEVVCLGQVPLVLSSPTGPGGWQDGYLQHHPPGIGDVAFQVRNLNTTVDRLLSQGGKLLDPIQTDTDTALTWCRVLGWGRLRHTLVQPPGPGIWIPGWGNIAPHLPRAGHRPIRGIDHAVLNVAAGQLQGAITWYRQQFGFCPRQQFTIDTPNSGLRSQVLSHPQGDAQLPINEPATANSQVQEFLTWNRGPGIQHVALQTLDILDTVKTLKTRGVQFLNVPPSYYQALNTRPGYSLAKTALEAIARLEILVDWEPSRPQACLLQTFTQPLLDIPTLFFEIIQRQTRGTGGHVLRAEGFGERNFRALFEAIEREQTKRGSLNSPSDEGP